LLVLILTNLLIIKLIKFNKNYSTIYLICKNHIQKMKEENKRSFISKDDVKDFLESLDEGKETPIFENKNNISGKKEKNDNSYSNNDKTAIEVSPYR